MSHVGRKCFCVAILIVICVGLYFAGNAWYRTKLVMDQAPPASSPFFLVHLRFGIAIIAQFAIALYVVGKLARSSR